MTSPRPTGAGERAETLLWRRAHAAWDDGRDPLDDDGVVELLVEHPELTADLLRARDRLGILAAASGDVDTGRGVLTHRGASSPTPSADAAPRLRPPGRSARWAAALLVLATLAALLEVGRVPKVHAPAARRTPDPSAPPDTHLAPAAPASPAAAAAPDAHVAPAAPAAAAPSPAPAVANAAVPYSAIHAFRVTLRTETPEHIVLVENRDGHIRCRRFARPRDAGAPAAPAAPHHSSSSSVAVAWSQTWTGP